MKIILISMPDVAPIIIHETAVHLHNHGIATVGGNIDSEHDVYLLDLIRNHYSIKEYLIRVVRKIKPEVIGLSTMVLQYDTCVNMARAGF